MGETIIMCVESPAQPRTVHPGPNDPPSTQTGNAAGCTATGLGGCGAALLHHSCAVCRPRPATSHGPKLSLQHAIASPLASLARGQKNVSQRDGERYHKSCAYSSCREHRRYASLNPQFLAHPLCSNTTGTAGKTVCISHMPFASSLVPPSPDVTAQGNLLQTTRGQVSWVHS